MANATVTCPDCDLRESFERLRAARARVETHRIETGHEATWELGAFAEGVVRAGEQAGVCGIPGTTDPDAPDYWTGE